MRSEHIQDVLFLDCRVEPRPEGARTFPLLELLRLVEQLRADPRADEIQIETLLKPERRQPPKSPADDGRRGFGISAGIRVRFSKTGWPVRPLAADLSPSRTSARAPASAGLAGLRS